MKKYITCVHDKKSDVFNGFMLHDNIGTAIKSFQQACDQVDAFKKWPEDYSLTLVCEIEYENGEINEKGEEIKHSAFNKITPRFITIAQAKDFIAIANAKSAKQD